MRSATTFTRLAALALVAGTAGAAAPPVEAAFPGGNGKIALARFYAPGTPSTSIFTVNPAGGTPAVLIRNGRLNFDPAWSANGNDLAFDSCPRTSNCNIFTARADGTGVTRITNNPYFEEFPRWGPDGDRIVFMRRVAGNMDIYVKHLGSGNVTRLTDSRAFDEFPEFSPDGTTATAENHGFTLIFALSMRTLGLPSNFLLVGAPFRPPPTCRPAISSAWPTSPTCCSTSVPRSHDWPNADARGSHRIRAASNGRAVAGERGQPREPTLLVEGEQTVRPIDRRADRLLTQIGVAPATEQVKPTLRPNRLDALPRA